MHLSDLLALRPVPAGGVFLTLTRRCPLTCAHCSTNSMLSSEEHDAEIFRRFVSTFTVDDHPTFVWLTGGEPLLRPALVEELTAAAHAAGSRVALVSGMFFARQRRIPPALLRALLAVDHVVASQDVYHEVQVPRADVFRAIATLLEAGQDVSFQIVGRGAEDPYLAELTGEIRAAFADRVPALVAPLGAVGRALSLPEALARAVPVASAGESEPAPCPMAAWPVVAFDGTIVACCNQRAVDGPAPAHLRLGHALVDGWPAIRARCTRSPVLRALRVFGPEVVAERYGGGLDPCDGYCGTCLKLSDAPGLQERLGAELPERRLAALDEQVMRIQTAAGARGFARRYGVRGYDHMLELGAEKVERCAV